MTRRSLNGADWSAMVLAGSDHLARHAEQVNELNVFPVPDGDTGTNMSMTMKAGAEELRRKPQSEIGRAAEVLSKGLLMGARGNSGVILSQLFRGFAQAVAGQRELTVPLFAAGLQQGVDTAYKSVVKPVEGTILTVAREAARHGVALARRTADIGEWMQQVRDKAAETLARTPDMLPVLKQVGVVDSGGQGLVYLYEGFAAYLRSGASAPESGREGGAHVSGAGGRSADFRAASGALAPGSSAAVRQSAQSKIDTESIRFPYDMEFFIRKTASASSRFSEAAFRKELEKDGDSIILIDDGDIVKVHVHSRRPGDVLNAALAYGELTNLHILNMRDQHRDLLRPADERPRAETEPERPGAWGEALGVEAASGVPAVEDPFGADRLPPGQAPHPNAYEIAAFGVVAVSAGEGNGKLLRSLGVDVVINGGQSMNPSTEDLLEAIRSLSVEHVFVLPNNANVLMAAEQAAGLADRPVTVIPTRSVPQGLAAMFAFREEDSASLNKERMLRAIDRVATGQITRAVRDTRMDGVEIRSGQYIGIKDKSIVAADDDLGEACRRLLADLIASGDEVVTILTGEGAEESVTEELLAWLEDRYPEAEIERHEGGQPLYPYWFMIESD